MNPRRLTAILTMLLSVITALPAIGKEKRAWNLAGTYQAQCAQGFTGVVQKVQAFYTLRRDGSYKYWDKVTDPENVAEEAGTYHVHGDTVQIINPEGKINELTLSKNDNGKIVMTTETGVEYVEQ